MLETIKMLLGLDDSTKDEIIRFYIDSVTQKILNYCNIPELTHELEPIVVEKVVTVMKESFTSNEQNLKSVSMGNISYTYADIEKSTNYLALDDVTAQLNRFRKVRFI